VVGQVFLVALLTTIADEVGSLPLPEADVAELVDAGLSRGRLLHF